MLSVNNVLHVNGVCALLLMLQKKASKEGEEEEEDDVGGDTWLEFEACVYQSLSQSWPSNPHTQGLPCLIAQASSHSVILYTYHAHF